MIGFTPMGRQAFDDSVQDGTDWYYFDASGDMKKDYWRTKAGEKYYYQADGKLARNKGLEIDGIWYYLQIVEKCIQAGERRMVIATIITVMDI